MAAQFASIEQAMQRAIELARLGEGRVEPNPMVGAVVVDRQLGLLAEAYHERFGGPHAEVNALAQAGAAARGATLVVTLEPCAHHGKTPPCAPAVAGCGIERVIVGLQDPFPQVAGKGIEILSRAGIQVDVGCCAPQVRALCAPWLKRLRTGLPWVIAKWAMSLDGRTASPTGASRWISNEASRAIVHGLRGRVDAVVVGLSTALADNPLLTPRPPGPRTPARVVLDSVCQLPPESQLAQTARQSAVIVAAGPRAPQSRVEALRALGVEVLTLPAEPGPAGKPAERPSLRALFEEFGRRQMTNVLVEGGGKLLASLFDAALVDEVHAFVAPALLGGDRSPSPAGNRPLAEPPDLIRLHRPELQVLEGDVYIHGRLPGRE